MLRGAGRVAIEMQQMPALVRDYIGSLVNDTRLDDLTPLIAAMRMIKSDEELQLARHAGAVANAMMEAGREALADGVAEYEVALATSRAGTTKSAELLARHYVLPKCHRIHTSCKSWRRVKTLSKPTIVPQIA